MTDLNHQNINTVNSEQQPKPVTIAAATTIAPSTFVTFISGATAIATITPPVSGAHMLCLINASVTNGTTTTAGNIAAAVTFGQNLATFFVYNPLTQKYYPGYTVAPD